MNFPPPTTRQAQVIWFAMTALAVALTLGIVGAVIWGVGRVLLVLSPVLWPLAVAAIIAMILDPVVEWLVGRNVPRLRAILLVFGVAAVLVLGVLGSIVPRVVVEARDLAGRIPGYASTAQTNLQKWINEPPASLIPLLPKSIQDRLPGRLRGDSSTETTNVAVRGRWLGSTPRAGHGGNPVPVTNQWFPRCRG
jgi:predicted PurR-regulated permease PerM